MSDVLHYIKRIKADNLIVRTANLEAESVTTEKLADEAVTVEKIE